MNLKSIFFNFFFLRKKFILCIPHINCRNDKYDLINYTGDNVLSYLHELNTQNTKLHDFKYFLVCYDKSRLGLINDYVAKNFKKIDLKLLFVDLDNHKFSIKNFKHKLFFLYIWLQSKFILLIITPCQYTCINELTFCYITFRTNICNRYDVNTTIIVNFRYEEFCTKYQ